MSTKTKVTATKNADAKPGAPKGLLVLINPESIVINEAENPRHDYGDIDELMRSIVENGIQPPLQGYEQDGKYILQSGFRRMRAVKLALDKGHTIEKIPFLLERKKKNKEERTLDHLLYNEGKPFSMMEQAEVIRRLLNFNWKIGDIAKRTGKARGYIDNLVLLTKAPMAVQNAIRDNKISAHAVIGILQDKKSKEEEVIAAVEEAIKNAQAAGKKKATPKHTGKKKAEKAEKSGNGGGRFYKYCEALANLLAEQKDSIIRERKEVLDTLIVSFENHKPVEKVIKSYFLKGSKK